MKYLITGICGHLGPHLANLLIEDGHEVYGLSRRTNGSESDIIAVMKCNFDKVTFLYGDLVDALSINHIFSSYKFDGCFHCAAMSNPAVSVMQPIATMQTNVIGTANIIQAIADYQPDCKLLFVSTSEVYGNSITVGEAIHEDHPLQAANPYSASKIASDVYLQERMRNGIIKGIITRAFSHLAPGRGKNFSISSDAYQIAKMMLGKQDKNLLVGNLNTVRVVIDARDVAKAYYRLMLCDKAVGQVFNVCGTIPHEMNYYTDLLIEHSKLSGVEKVIHKPFWREHDIFYQRGSVDKLKQYINWEPEIPISTTMKDVLDFWIKRLS